MAQTKYRKFVDGKFDGKVPFKDVAGMTDQEIFGLLQVSQLYYTQGRFDAAQTILEGLAVMDPDNKLVQSALGAVYTKKGNNDAALVALNKAAKLNPGDISIYVNRGEVLIRLGKVQEAAGDFKKALEMDPDRKSPAANRARLILVGLAAVAQKAREKQA
jgi:tetratricopeptide (TPR) repeat protein